MSCEGSLSQNRAETAKWSPPPKMNSPAISPNPWIGLGPLDAFTINISGSVVRIGEWYEFRDINLGRLRHKPEHSS